MKSARFLYLFAILCVLRESTVYGQNEAKRKETFSAGHWQVNLKDGLGKGNELSEFFNGQQVYRHNILQAQAGYYVVDGLLVGIGFSWSREWSPDRPIQESFTDFMKGPLIRYQFTNSRVSPFLEASYQFGRRNTDLRTILDFISSSAHSTLLNTGVSIGLTSFLRVDASYGVQFKTFVNQSFINTYPQVGVNYVFGGQ